MNKEFELMQSCHYAIDSPPDYVFHLKEYTAENLFRNFKEYVLNNPDRYYVIKITEDEFRYNDQMMEYQIKIDITIAREKSIEIAVFSPYSPYPPPLWRSILANIRYWKWRFFHGIH